MNSVFIGIAVSITVNLITAAYVYGKLTQTVTDLSRRTADLERENDKIWKVTNYNSNSIANVKGQLGQVTNGH